MERQKLHMVDSPIGIIFRQFSPKHTSGEYFEPPPPPAMSYQARSRIIGFTWQGSWLRLTNYLLVVCIWRHQKHYYADDDQFAPNFHMVCKTIQCVSPPNFKLFGPMETELCAKAVEEFSIRLYGKLGCWGLFCPPTWLPQYKCMEIFKLWTAVALVLIGISIWNLQRSLKMGLFTLCKNLVKKIVSSNFWWRHCKPEIHDLLQYYCVKVFSKVPNFLSIDTPFRK